MRFLLLIGLLLASIGAACAEPLDADRAAGRILFVEGVGAAGAVAAALGTGQVAVQATSVPCASCHGRDGRGRPEGAIVPPDITGPVLGAPADRPGPDGGKRRAYDQAALVRAVTLGIDVEGRPLDPIMPRYRLTLDDADHLVRYLETLGAGAEPGVTPDRLVLGTILPRADAPAGALLRAFVDRLDAAGGVFGRRVEIVVAPAAASPAEAARHLMATQPVFALVAPWIAHDERPVADYAQAEGVPMVGPETLRPDAAGPSQRYLFFLDGGVPAEAQALALAADRLGRTPVAIIDGADPVAGAAAAAAFARAGTPALRKGLSAADTPETLVRDLSQAGIGRILWLAPGLDVFAAAAVTSGYRPTLLVPAEFGAGTLGPGTLPAALALRAGPDDQTEEALAAYRELAAAYHLPDTDRPAQLHALVAIRLLIATLERAGRDVTREGLVTALEATGDFRSGLMPPLSYGQSRRIGSTGAWILLPGAAPEWLDPARR
jgi:ABC-type branched-subunit amino acid transport system substrate-binding protein